MNLSTAAEVSLRVTSEPAFERAYDACAPSLYRFFVVRTGDSHLADDLMQQLWLQGRNGAENVPPANLEYWLRAIARNLLRTHWRVKARRPVAIAVPDPDVAADLSERLVNEEIPAADLENKEIRDQLLLAITDLSSQEQELIVGCYFENLSHAALAARLGISERAIEGRLYRARQALRQRLKALSFA